MLGSSVYSSASDSRLEILRVKDLKALRLCSTVQTCSQGGELEKRCSSSSLSNGPEFNSSQLTSKVLFWC